MVALQQVLLNPIIEFLITSSHLWLAARKTDIGHRVLSNLWLQ
jgi:hypothetical protein